jgi:hypothetical protein
MFDKAMKKITLLWMPQFMRQFLLFYNLKKPRRHKKIHVEINGCGTDDRFLKMQYFKKS